MEKEIMESIYNLKHTQCLGIVLGTHMKKKHDRKFERKIRPTYLQFVYV